MMTEPSRHSPREEIQESAMVRTTPLHSVHAAAGASFTDFGGWQMPLRYASDLVGKDYVMSDKYLQDIVRDKMYWENKRRNIHDREKKLEQTISHYEEELTTLSQRKREVLSDARQEAERLLQASNAAIENTIRAIKESQADRERTRAARQELQDFRDEMKEKADRAQDDAIMDRVNYMVMIGDSYRELKNYDKARQYYNQGFAETLRLENMEMPQAMLQGAIKQKLATLELLEK